MEFEKRRFEFVSMGLFYYDKEKKHNEPEGWLARQYNIAKEAFLAHPNVLKATAYRDDVMRLVRTETNDEFSMLIQEVDEDFIETFEMKIIVGRTFHRDDPIGEPNSALLNETAVEILGWKEPVGQQVFLGKNDKVTVVGVVKDFHFSFQEDVKPRIILNRHTEFSVLSVKARRGDLPETLAFLEQTWKQFLPEHPFTFWFMNETDRPFAFPK